MIIFSSARISFSDGSLVVIKLSLLIDIIIKLKRKSEIYKNCIILWVFTKAIFFP